MQKPNTHVIVHKESWQKEKGYKTKGAAEGAMKRTKERGGICLRYPETKYEVMTLEAWEAGDYLVDTINILNPKAGTFKIRRSQQGTCCDPSTERYHSM